MQNFVSPLPDLSIASGGTTSNSVFVSDARSLMIGAPAFLGVIKIQVAPVTGGTFRNFIAAGTGLALVGLGAVPIVDPPFSFIRVISLAAQTGAKTFKLTKSFQS